MTIEEVLGLIPDYAYDMKKNLQELTVVENWPGLHEKEIAAVAVAAALTAPAKHLYIAIEAWAAEKLDEQELKGAKSAHEVMSMTNVYYRFLHIADNREYKRMPPKLHMQVENNPGISKRAWELAALGVSAINNCKACIDYHELALRRMGVSAKGIQSSVRIAAILKAVGECIKFEA